MTPLREVIYNAWNRLSFAGSRSVREKLFSRSPLLPLGGTPFVTTRVWSAEDFDG